MAVRVTYYIIFFLSYYSLSLFIFVFHYLNLLKYSRDGVHFIIFSLFPSFSIISFHYTNSYALKVVPISDLTL